MTTIIPIDIHTCRICLENDNITNLIRPCKCDGSIRYTHLRCINEWRKTTNVELYKTHCNICNHKYNSPKMISFINDKSYFKCLIYNHLIILSIFSNIIYFIDKDHNLSQSIGINDNSYLQKSRIYYFISFCYISGISIILHNKNIIELNKQYYLLYLKFIISNKFYLLFTLSTLIYYLFAWDYTNCITDLFSLLGYEFIILNSHNDAIKWINENYIQNEITEYTE